MFKMNMEESNNGSKKLQIRNSTAEFLIFQIEKALKCFIRTKLCG